LGAAGTLGAVGARGAATGRAVDIECEADAAGRVVMACGVVVFVCVAPAVFVCVEAIVEVCDGVLV
jgi:hypothetical protein